MPDDIDLKLEAIVIPVADVDRSKAFYARLGWRLDADFAFDNGFRVVQFTPPGSPASIQFGTRITQQRPGTAEGVHLVVNDAQAAHERLAALGAEVEDVFHPHGVHEAADLGGVRDEQWPQWYAAYMVAEPHRTDLP
jgi:catechol 2,3-dioxygenase-like lactoylglutathione lyase family enzyme